MFWIDLLSVMPFDRLISDFVEDPDVLKAFSILKLFRVLRLSKMITYMNSTDDVKHSLKLFNLIFFLVLYVHLSGCLWIYINSFVDDEEKWKPSKFSGWSYEQFAELRWPV